MGATAIDTLTYDLRKKSPRTRQRYVGIVRGYLQFSGGTITRPMMLHYMEQKEAKWGGNTRRLAHYALARLCKALEVKFPLDADDLAPTPTRDELRTPTLSIDEVASLIRHWKSSPCWETGLLYLSTIYGLRSIELSMVDVEKGAITAWLAKKGRKTPLRHTVPPGGNLYLWDYGMRCEWLVIQAFHKIEDVAGMKREKGKAWHSIRRALATNLRLNGVDPEIITRFLGWEKVSPLVGGVPLGASPMVGVYTHIPPEEIDRMIFRQHPFLGMW